MGGDGALGRSSALSYTAFAAVRGWPRCCSGAPIGSCGCIGQADIAPRRLHVVVDVARWSSDVVVHRRPDRRVADPADVVLAAASLIA